MMSQRKDNDMICNGAIPSQMVMIMDAYGTYVNAMTAAWQAWAELSGWHYYQSQYQAMLARMNQELDRK